MTKPESGFMEKYTSVEDIIRHLSDLGHQKVKVAVTDIDGVLRGKYIHIDKFISASEKGFGFCNVIFGWDSSDQCYMNSKYTGWHTGYPDAEARIDLKTLRFIPWDDKTPFFLADFQNAKGEPLEICPRQILKKVIGLMQSMGFSAKVGVEFEWFNFKETPESVREKNYKKLVPLSPGMFGYSVLRSSLNHEFFKNLMESMHSFNVPLEGLHTETGPGVLEGAIMNCDPLTAADRGTLFKTGVKEIGSKLGILASFMPRWNTDLAGCGGHLHMSLLDDKGASVFADTTARHKMSALFQSFLAGQIQYIPELLALFAPTVNSFKRLVEGYWAPTRATWGLDNRTCAFRVINSHASATRVEVRVGGSDINPYLAIAAALGAGLMGVKKQLRLDQAPIVGNGYQDSKAAPFARNLLGAAEGLRKSEIACELFGENFVEHFANTRTWEWDLSQRAVNDWELQRYLEII